MNESDYTPNEDNCFWRGKKIVFGDNDEDNDNDSDYMPDDFTVILKIKNMKWI